MGQERVEDALRLYEQSLLIKRDLGDPLEIVTGLCGVARAIAAAGQPETAAQLISSVESLREEIGGGEAWVSRMNHETLATVNTRLDETAFAAAWEQGRELNLDRAIGLALDALAER